MRSKGVIGFILLGFYMAAGAEETKFDIRLKAKGGPNVLVESEHLQLQSEPSVQAESRPSQRSYLVGFSRMSAGHVVVTTPYRSVDYDLGQDTNFLRFSYLSLPWTAFGQWGWQAGVGYGFVEQSLSTKTVLHLIPASVEAVYRGRTNRLRHWALQASLGAGNIIFVQRGSPQYETSQSDWMGIASLGLWLGLGEWIEPRSPIPAELILNYSRQFAANSGEANWNGSQIGLALGVGL